MNTDRRAFLTAGAAIGGAAALLPTRLPGASHATTADYARLDEARSQPVLKRELFYFGGMTRTMQVARMAKAAGLRITPHTSGGGLGFLYMLHMVAVCPAAYEFHEFKMFTTRDANGTPFAIESTGNPFESSDGTIKAPTGPGLGVRIDPDYVRTHQLFTG